MGVLNEKRCKDPMRFLFWTFLDIFGHFKNVHFWIPQDNLFLPH